MKHDPVKSVTERRILVVSALSNPLADRYGGYADETSIFGKLSWLSNCNWILRIKPGLSIPWQNEGSSYETCKIW